MVLQFPPNPTVGQVFQLWTWDGQKWVCTGGGGVTPPVPPPGGEVMPVNQVVFTASGVYTRTPGLVSAIVELTGGGGAGAGVEVSTGTLAGGGGGSGAYTRAVFSAAQLGASQLVTIGPGGVGAAGAVKGGDGSMSSFGGLLTAPGGFGGDANISGGAGAPAMANPPPGVLALPGNGGSAGEQNLAVANFVIGGTGASSYYSGDAVGTEVVPGNSAPGNSASYGSGGSGAAQSNGTTPQPGGRGGDGLCVITEFIATPQ